MTAAPIGLRTGLRLGRSLNRTNNVSIVLGASQRAYASFRPLHHAGPRRSDWASSSRKRSFSRSSHAPNATKDETRPPLLQLRNAWLRSVWAAQPDTSHSGTGGALDWTIRDRAKQECWAIIGPASERGGRARREVVDVILGRSRPKQASSKGGDDLTAICQQIHGRPYHPNVHPFLSDRMSGTAGELRRTPHDAIKHVSFATQIGGTGGEFVNYSARYGAIREQDRVTLYERLMDLLGVPVGLVAAQKMLPDPFAASTGTAGDAVGLFKWSSEQARQTANERALEADAVVRQMAPLLLIDDHLLHRPVIALSNGQTRRARILSSLVSGAELVVLEEPYSGIDAGTRQKLSQLFARLHAERRPRFVLVLREQDEVPDFITHLLRLDESGAISHLGERKSDDSNQATALSHDAKSEAAPRNLPARADPYDLLLRNAAEDVGRGDERQPPIISMNDVSVAYGNTKVLDSINLRIWPGDRIVLAGDNGSGKTTLLALILGDHPRSFSFPRDQLSLFGMARDEPLNARPLLGQRIGHLSPELFNAFPRKSAERGGLTVGEVIASGYGNVFARRSYSEAQKQRVWALLSRFAHLVKSSDGRTIMEDAVQADRGGAPDLADVRAVSSRGFTELSHGSQAVVLFLRALVGRPRLLVLDEPFQGMDAKQVETIRRFLDDSTARSVAPDRWAIGETAEEKAADTEARQQMAIVLVSHYESEWPTRFGRLIRLKGGLVEERV
ncbi:uncharacterized protein PFL1_05721 [Pseudozyma flocculosa PF-1]|uniref:ABC transporter domain-containing protein n=1 Tax=Pseudozyma flocculosa PF-1 TaxID=1277687 RepID=A0A061H227_9BASI|nr:uncharacterized protein PFL1_05721 [Pseudozyma flocculosa PF-1]EPQ26742.1 hypothetical protein PFL1_05721 [Pseudozyma flocculosa PF-1]